MKNEINILIQLAYFSDEKDKLLESIITIAPNAKVIFSKTDKFDEKSMENADIIFGWPEKEQLLKASKLKWLHMPSAGVESYIDRNLYASKNVLLTNSSSVFGLPIAEHVFALILAYTKNIPLFTQLKQQHLWKNLDLKMDIFGSTFGIIGLGDIGSEVAKRAKAWGAKVIAIKRSVANKPDYVDELYGEEGIDKLIEVSDFIVLALPSTSKTRGVISKERISKMKSNAFIVNIGRGALIDQEALIEALSQNRIAGAGLDVTSPEPLPKDNPLWDLPNVIITPHTSGNSITNPSRAIPIFLNNLNNYLEGKPLQNIVDFETEY